jgi:hypothetical protein
MVVQAGWTTNLPGVEVVQSINAANKRFIGWKEVAIAQL